MTKKWIFINLLLLAIAIIAGWQLYASVQQFTEDNDLSKIEPAGSLSQKAAQDIRLPAEISTHRYSPMEFAVIPEKNVFSESRSREISPDTPTITGTIPDSKLPVLVGIVLSGEQKVASILPPAERGRTPQIEMMQIGDAYEGYRVTDIQPDHIVFSSGNLKETVYLNDSSLPAQRTKTPIKATEVIRFSPAAAAANASTFVAFGSNNNRRALNQAIVAAAASQARNPAADGTQRNVITVAPIQQSGTQPAAVFTTPQTNQVPTTNQNGGTTRGSRVIPSPFGDITRNPPN